MIKRSLTAEFIALTLFLFAALALLVGSGLYFDTWRVGLKAAPKIEQQSLLPQPEQGENRTHLPLIQRSDATPPSHPAGAGATYYVSKRGNNEDGRSWETAWNELNQIDWAVVEPGDTILLDGGAEQMVYQSTLTVRQSGAEGRPITIRLADEEGRNGQVVIFGGRSTPLPYCGQEDYVFEQTGVRTLGILVRRVSWVVIDGQKWRGIVIYGHNRYGIELYASAYNVTIRNVEIFDNGTAIEDDGQWRSDFPGVNLGGTNIIIERALVHDNGQDAFQWHQTIANFTLRESWLYNNRRHPDGTISFNDCTHTDGIQIYNGGDQYGFLIEETIIGPGLSNGTLLGQSPHPTGIEATVHEVTFRNVLFIKATDNNLAGYSDTKSQDWVIDHVTVYCPNTLWQCLYLEGAGHSVTNSIFVGSHITLPDGLALFYDNCQWRSRGFRLGDNEDPLFASVDEDDPFALGDYSLQPGSPCEGRGSNLTSVGQLLGQPDPDRVITELEWEAEEGYVAPPFLVTDEYIVQRVETTDVAMSGRASYRFHIETAGDYLVKMVVDAPDEGANSLFVNIDAEPDEPGMIWDIEVTDGFEGRTVSWRGAGTPTASEFVPQVFSLTAGEHTLIIRGREANTRVDRIQLEPVLPEPACPAPE
jgi:hypothetical protein